VAETSSKHTVCRRRPLSTVLVKLAVKLCTVLLQIFESITLEDIYNGASKSVSLSGRVRYSSATGKLVPFVGANTTLLFC
jgi:hypothetical protein